jgi:hypothetical protein
MLITHLNYKLKNKLIYIIFISISIKVPHLYSFKARPLIHFYLAILLNIREKTNMAKSLLTFIRVKVIVVNI